MFSAFVVEAVAGGGEGEGEVVVGLAFVGFEEELVCAGSEWAMLCGIAPIPATSGLTANQFRLNHAGDRHANNAIWRIVITRLGQHEPRTIAYMQRRRDEGRSKRDIIRCLKRYVAREILKALPR